ncbi:MAG: DHH family phosphoesterase [Phycisphaerales bacterium]
MTHPWSSNTTIADLAAWLRARRRVVVLTHLKPDGDALGSTLAATRAINLAAAARGTVVAPHATPWYAGPMPDWAAEIIGPTEHRLLTQAHRPDHDHREEPDAVLVIDTGAWTQLHEVREWLLPRREIAAIIDHHRQGDADVADRRLIRTDAAAACEPCAELCCALLGVPSPARLPIEIATPLYLGLATDTGWFRHSSVTPGVMRLAADLLQAGVDHARLYESVEQRDRPSRLRLMARALASMKLLNRDRVSMMTLTLQDFHDCNAASTDSAGFAELALTAAPVQVSVLVTEAFVTDHAASGHVTKVSFRSKNGPDSMDVNEVARKLGGGGHIRAAGAKVHADLAETTRRIVEALK